MAENTEKALVIDNGPGTIKAGFDNLSTIGKIYKKSLFDKEIQDILEGFHPYMGKWIFTGKTLIT